MTNPTELREAITRSRAGQSRWRCPSGLRAKIVRFTQEQREEGRSMMQIAKELGVSESGLSRWLQAGEPMLRPVRIVEAPAPSIASLVLVTPGGYRLEGLSVLTASEVLRHLGC